MERQLRNNSAEVTQRIWNLADDCKLDAVCDIAGLMRARLHGDDPSETHVDWVKLDKHSSNARIGSGQSFNRGLFLLHGCLSVAYKASMWSRQHMHLSGKWWSVTL